MQQLPKINPPTLAIPSIHPARFYGVSNTTTAIATIRFEFIIVIALLLSIAIVLVYGLQYDIIVALFAIATIVKYEFICGVCNGPTIALAVSIIIKFTTAVAVLILIINVVYDFITVKIGFNCMVFHIISNGINTPLYTAIEIQFIAAFDVFLATIIGYGIGLFGIYAYNDMNEKGNVFLIFLHFMFSYKLCINVDCVVLCLLYLLKT